MTNTALITGISGFVGPYLAKRLHQLDWDVYGMVRNRADGKKPERLLSAVDNVKLLDGDVTDLTSLISILDKTQPDLIFHLASQSYVPRSFTNPLETFRTNSLGTQNLLEAVRLKDIDCKIVFAGSSEEYGLQIASAEHYQNVLERYGAVFPEPQKFPELPVKEDNPLRPMSPYAVSKVNGDFLMRNYCNAYGLKTIVSRAFNHEGAGRGPEFVTSTIVRQCVSLKFGELSKITIGNVNVFRDWSHIEDIIDGYILLSERGKFGDVYIQGSMRMNSVITYILLTLAHLGYRIMEIETLRGKKKVNNPIEIDKAGFFSVNFEITKIDKLLLNDLLEYVIDDRGLKIKTDKGDIIVEFDASRFRSADVPILLSDTRKIQSLGFRPTRSLKDVIGDQVNYYLNPENRRI
jgi:GDPmannose 4,6-dehydratase